MTDVDMGPSARQRAEAEFRKYPGSPMVCTACRKVPSECQCAPDMWFWQPPPRAPLAWLVERERQAPVASESPESVLERIPTAADGVPVVMADLVGGCLR